MRLLCCDDEDCALDTRMTERTAYVPSPCEPVSILPTDRLKGKIRPAPVL
jgi:hypothetical protein